MKKLLVSDYDGTFKNDKDGSIKANIDEVSKFMSNGNIFTLASARSYNSLIRQVNKYNIPYDYLICNNGGVVYDKNGNYFRIEDTTRPRGRNYLDIDGNDMNNEVVNGKTRGRSRADYQRVTHFNNSDK